MADARKFNHIIRRKVTTVRNTSGESWVVYEGVYGEVGALPSEKWVKGTPVQERAFKTEYERHRKYELSRKNERQFGVHTSRGMVTRTTRTQYIVGGYRYSRTTRYRVGGSGYRDRLTDEDVEAIEAIVNGRAVVDIVAERKAASEGK